MLTLLWVLASGATPSLTLEETLPPFSRAYDTAFRRLGTLELSDTKSRIDRLGAAGKPFQPALAELRTRQGEVNDLLVKAVGLKKQGLAEKKPALVEEATRVLVDADTKAQRARADLDRLNEKLTTAGAPEIKPGPERDPNARD